ncbi:MAG: SpoIIE family protein phosphatase [Planctomycetaceae bacterium]|nr:SpoIIE family protein phosphatase [Planctomycetaceae bacterium]
MAILQAVQGPEPGRTFPLDVASIILGRHPNCDIVLESGSVSRQHARVLNIEGVYWIEDLHSRNGTLLNGRPVTTRQMLCDNDQIGICDLSFSFHLGPEDVSVTPPAGQRRDTPPAATIVDDDRPHGASTIMSKFALSTGATGLRLEVNPEAKLKALLEISQNLGKALALADVLPKLLDSLFAIFLQADRAFIVLREPTTGRLVPKAVKHRRADDAQTLRISRTVVSNVMTTKEAILSADAASDFRFGMAESIVDFQIHSMICAPLVNREGEALGVIQLDTLDPRNRFQPDDLEMLAAVACQAAFAVENAQLHEMAMQDQALRRELAVAHEVQRGFLPATAPRIPEYDFFEFYEPASQLGGDYYDYVELPGGRLAIVVADVSGKGISASLLMAKLSAETRYCLASEPEPAQAMGRLNRVFCESAWEDRFVTMVLAVLDPRRHGLAIINAGHLPPLLRRGPHVVEPVAQSEANLPLGVDRNVDYAEYLLPLSPGDSLVLYTDGITEAMNTKDELYGLPRLLTVLDSDVDRVKLLGRRILDDVKRFVGPRPQSDDMCLSCFGRVKV